MLLDLAREGSSLPWLLDKVEVYFGHALVPDEAGLSKALVRDLLGKTFLLFFYF